MSSSTTNNNSKIAAGPLSGNEANYKATANGAAIYLNEDELDEDGDQMPSDTDEDDDDEERLDCVHDIHGDGDEADVEEIDGDDDCDLSNDRNNLSHE